MDEQARHEINTEDGGAGNEPVLFSTGRHWAVFLPPFVLLIFAGLSVPSKGLNAWIIVGISLVWIILTSLSHQASEYRVTGTGIFVTVRFPRKKTSFIPLSSIGAVDVYQPALGKLLDFGRVRLRMTDGSVRYLKMVRGPHTLTARISAVKAAAGEEK